MHLENIRCALLDHNLVFSRFNWVPMVCGAPEKIGSPLQEMNQILMFQRWSKFEFLGGWYSLVFMVSLSNVVCFVSFLRRDVSFFQKSRHYEKTLHFVFTERNPVLPEIFFSRQMEPMEPKNGDVGRWCSFSKEWFGGSSRQFSGECQRKIPKMMPFEASINWTKKAFLQASPLHFSQGQGLISWYLIGFFPLS